jgi:hypothetical protein
MIRFVSNRPLKGKPKEKKAFLLLAGGRVSYVGISLVALAAPAESEKGNRTKNKRIKVYSMSWARRKPM